MPFERSRDIPQVPVLRGVLHAHRFHSGAVNVMTTPQVQYDYADGSANTIRPTRMVYPDGRELNYSYGDVNSVDDAASRRGGTV